MGLPAEKPRRATYQDVLEAPPHMVAEIVNGVLHVFPRPSPRHAHTASAVGVELGGPFGRGKGGPGGWRILDEPELHFGPADDPDVLVPDLAGWRIERMPILPATAYIRTVPDWVCEVASPSTEDLDREEKMPIYAREGVRHAWLTRPVKRMLEVYRLGPDGFWVLLGTHSKNAVVQAEPFQDIPLELSALWADVEGGDDEEAEMRRAPKPYVIPFPQPKTQGAVPANTARSKPAKKTTPRKR